MTRIQSLIGMITGLQFVLGMACAQQPAIAEPEVREAGIAELRAALDDGRVTSRQLVDRELTLINLHDESLQAMISINPGVLEQAERLDHERANGKVRGPIHGIPLVLKDNVDYAAGFATTAGSLALANNFPSVSAHLVRRLVDAGALILGKANLSEWANIRSSWSTSGWSAVGGLTRNPYDFDRSACGSSSGSAVAVAAGLAVAAIGTETDGSITCPASMTGLVGLKPTVGLVSRSGIVPISRSQDTAGPLTRSVADAAAILTAIAGSDPADPDTTEADAHRTDYLKGLDPGSLRGARIGVMRFISGQTPQTIEVFDATLDALRAQGAVLVDIDAFDFGEIHRLELGVLLTELKVGLNAYLAKTPPGVKTRSLAEVIAFNRTEPRETIWFGQDLFEKAEATGGLTDPEYLHARDTARRLAGPEGIDRLLRAYDVAALVAPTNGPAWTIDLVNGDRSGSSASTLPAVAGYPHLTVPMGQVAGLPVGLSFIGPAWSEQLLLSLGYAFELATHARKPPKDPVRAH